MDNAKEDMEAKKLPVQRAMVLVWDRNNKKSELMLTGRATASV